MRQGGIGSKTSRLATISCLRSTAWPMANGSIRNFVRATNHGARRSEYPQAAHPRGSNWKRLQTDGRRGPARRIPVRLVELAGVDDEHVVVDADAEAIH